MSTERARLFQNGGSQAVRLPKQFSFPGLREVSVRRRGRSIVLEPVDQDKWQDQFLSCLGGWPESISRPKQPSLRRQKNPFP